MTFDTVSDKDLQQLERLTSELIAALRRAKMTDEPLTEDLLRMQQELGDVRRQRFDRKADQYVGY